MIPTMLAREVRRGVEDYIRTTFPVTSPYFRGMLDGFLQRENGLFRGPFVFLGLPFSPGRGRGEFFPEVPLGYPPYLHQENAFARMPFPGKIHGDRHGNRFGQDGVLPLAGTRLLPEAQGTRGG
jgi:DEAD/DEAH box helicase domain-containing protein